MSDVIGAWTEDRLTRWLDTHLERRKQNLGDDMIPAVTAVGTLIAKIMVVDRNGRPTGFVPVYETIS